MSNKTKIDFDGFEEVVARLSRLNGNIKSITEKALKDTHKVITEKAEKTIKPHRLTGQTEDSLKQQANIEWTGTLASVETGFSIRKGGLASIFLMYGTPRMMKDQKLWNAFWSKKTKNEINKIQENVFYDEIRRLNG